MSCLSLSVHVSIALNVLLGLAGLTQGLSSLPWTTPGPIPTLIRTSPFPHPPTLHHDLTYHN